MPTMSVALLDNAVGSDLGLAEALCAVLYRPAAHGSTTHPRSSLNRSCGPNPARHLPPPLPPVPPKGMSGAGVMQVHLEHQRLDHGHRQQDRTIAERITGAAEVISISAEPKVKTVIPVIQAGDGGLMDIVLSPTYCKIG